MSDTSPAALPVPPAPAPAPGTAPRRPAAPLPPNHGLAVLLLTLAVLAWQVFQGVMLWQERSNLQALQAAQQPQIEAANKVRGALDALATATSQLAAGGNANAQAIVTELARRGVTINPPKQ